MSRRWRPSGLCKDQAGGRWCSRSPRVVRTLRSCRAMAERRRRWPPASSPGRHARGSLSDGNRMALVDGGLPRRPRRVESSLAPRQPGRHRRGDPGARSPGDLDGRLVRADAPATAPRAGPRSDAAARQTHPRDGRRAVVREHQRRMRYPSSPLACGDAPRRPSPAAAFVEGELAVPRPPAGSCRRRATGPGPLPSAARGVQPRVDHGPRVHPDAPARAAAAMREGVHVRHRTSQDVARRRSEPIDPGTCRAARRRGSDGRPRRHGRAPVGED